MARECWLAIPAWFRRRVRSSARRERACRRRFRSLHPPAAVAERLHRRAHLLRERLRACPRGARTRRRRADRGGGRNPRRRQCSLRSRRRYRRRSGRASPASAQSAPPSISRRPRPGPVAKAPAGVEHRRSRIVRILVTAQRNRGEQEQCARGDPNPAIFQHARGRNEQPRPTGSGTCISETWLRMPASCSRRERAPGPIEAAATTVDRASAAPTR